MILPLHAQMQEMAEQMLLLIPASVLAPNLLYFVSVLSGGKVSCSFRAPRGHLLLALVATNVATFPPQSGSPYP